MVATASSQHPPLTELHILFHFIFYENSLSQQLSNVPHSVAVMAPRCASWPRTSLPCRFVPLAPPLTPGVPETPVAGCGDRGWREVVTDCSGARLGLQAEARESRLYGRRRCPWLPSPHVVDFLISDFGWNLGTFGSKERTLPRELKWTESGVRKESTKHLGWRSGCFWRGLEPQKSQRTSLPSPSLPPSLSPPSLLDSLCTVQTRAPGGQPPAAR